MNKREVLADAVYQFGVMLVRKKGQLTLDRQLSNLASRICQFRRSRAGEDGEASDTHILKQDGNGMTVCVANN